MEDYIGNRHYIITDDRGRIVDGWSDGPHPDRDPTGAICINEQGGYQFRLYPLVLDPPYGEKTHIKTEENPALWDMAGIPLYKWEDGEVLERTQEEMEADRAAIPEPSPSTQEQLRADVDFLAAMQGVSL